MVRRATAENLARDRQAVATGALLALHAAVARQLDELARTPDPARLYAVPYAIAYAEPLGRAFRLLNAAADAVERDDEELARYLRNRARDLLTQRLRERRRGVGHRPVPAPQRADRRVRDL